MSSLFLVGVTRTLMTLPLAEFGFDDGASRGMEAEADVLIAGDMEDF